VDAFRSAESFFKEDTLTYDASRDGKSTTIQNLLKTFSGDLL
jgi:hypothetical protein